MAWVIAFAMFFAVSQKNLTSLFSLGQLVFEHFFYFVFASIYHLTHGRPFFLWQTREQPGQFTKYTIRA
jgi:hypothetical protein